MPDLKLSLPQRALLIILMAENIELSNTEIKERFAPGLQLRERHVILFNVVAAVTASGFVQIGSSPP